MKNGIWVTIVLLASASGLGVLSGCEQANGNAPAEVTATSTVGTIAVVDLDEVARGLGKQAEWKSDLESQQQRLRGEYQTINQSLTSQLEQMQSQLGEEPTDDQRRQLQAGIVQARQIMRNAELQANALLQQRRDELIADFRDRVQPIVRKVADKQGFDVVIVKGANVMAASEAADITQAVLNDAMVTIGKSEAPADAASEVDDATEPVTTPDANAVGE